MKSNILWVRYNIDWFKMADNNCKKCYGRGFIGYEPNTDRKVHILCDCVANKWTNMTDEERLKYATEKKNADEIVDKIKTEIKNIVNEYKK